MDASAVLTLRSSETQRLVWGLSDEMQQHTVTFGVSTRSASNAYRSGGAPTRRCLITSHSFVDLGTSEWDSGPP